MGAARLPQNKARLGLAQVYDLEGRVKVDHELVHVCGASRVGLRDPQDRVVAVAVRTRLLIFARLIKQRVDLFSECREAQQPRLAELDVGNDRRGVKSAGLEQADARDLRPGSAATALTRRARGPGFAAASFELPRSRFSSTTASASAHLRVRIDEQPLQMLDGVRPVPQSGSSGAKRQSLPAQSRGVVGQCRQEECGRGAARPERGKTADSP